jgi:hypothetical protein
MSRSSFFPYIHHSILEMDLRGKPEFYHDFYRNTRNKIIHEVVYETGLPKRLELHDALDSNPYHLLFYMLARFFYFDDGETEIVFYYKDRLTYLVEAALRLLPPRFKRLTEKEEGVEYVGLPGCVYLVDSIEEPWIYLYVKDLYKDIWSIAPKQKGKRIFISRHTSKGRQLEMDPAFVKGLLDLGFSIYTLEQMSMKDQIQLFHSAEMVVGPHGAGLAWITFCEETTVVIEICPNEPGRGHYAAISKEIGLNYERYSDCRLEGPDVRFVLDSNLFLDHLRTRVKN